MSAPYLPPLDHLLALGEPAFETRRTWPDYLAIGFGEEHVPELIRLLTDEELSSGALETPASWASLHAWRILGLLRAEEAIEPLIATLSTDDDWAMTEVPGVLGMIGPAALERCAWRWRGGLWRRSRGSPAAWEKRSWTSPRGSRRRAMRPSRR